MQERGNELTRGQWMATEGRELYHDWLTDLLKRYPAKEADYSGIFKFEEVDDVAREMRSSLSHFALTFGIQLIDHTSEQHDMRMLLESMDDVKRYTSADEMNGEFPNWPQAVTRHAKDGIDFACKVSVGLAYDACEAAGYPIENSVEAYDTLSDIMHDPSFHRVLEQFSTTGFGVLRNQTRNTMLMDDMPQAVGNIIGLKNLVDHIVHASRGMDGKVRYSLDPVIAKKLIDRMREQNKDHRLPQSESMAMRDRIEEPSFTSGCPVRRAPQSAINKGEQKSGIALLSEYMGDELVRVVNSQARQAELASTAIRSL